MSKLSGFKLTNQAPMSMILLSALGTYNSNPNKQINRHTGSLLVTH